MMKIFLTTSTLSLLLLSAPPTIWLFLPPCLLLLLPLSLPLLYSPLNMPKFYSFFYLDPLSAPLVTLSLWISALMVLASTKILFSRNAPVPFTSWITMLTIALLLSFASNNMLMFYIFFESTLIPTCALILGWGYQPERLQASFYFILYTVFASLPLLSAIVIILSYQGHTFFFHPWHLPPLPHSLVTPWWIMVNAAFLAKLPMFLTHLWLPKAHVEAPVAGSMILAAILLKLGGYGLIRSTTLLPPSISLPKSMVMAISLWGATITSIICLRQSDLKALIAYSSVGHMGLLIAGTLTNSPLGISGASSMMIAHGLTSSGLFFLANTTYEVTNTRSVFLTKGLISFLPNLSLWWLLLSAANMAAPPSLNLFSEILLMTSILSWSPLSIPFLAATSFLTAAYSLFMYSSTNHGLPSPSSNPISSPPSATYTTLLLHTLPTVTLLLKPELLIIL